MHHRKKVFERKRKQESKSATFVSFTSYFTGESCELHLVPIYKNIGLNRPQKTAAYQITKTFFVRSFEPFSIYKIFCENWKNKQSPLAGTNRNEFSGALRDSPQTSWLSRHSNLLVHNRSTRKNQQDVVIAKDSRAFRFDPSIWSPQL